MNKNTEETDSLGEEIDIEETQDQPTELGPRNSKTNNKKRRPKRGGCGSLPGPPQESIGIAKLTPRETGFLGSLRAGGASTFLAGNPGTTLAGGSTVSLLPDTPRISLLLLSKENIQQGEIIKKTDLEVYVLPKNENIPDKPIRVEDLVGKVAPDSIPANTLLGLVVLTGDPASYVEIKHISDRALVIRTKNAIQKRDVIKKEDLEVYLVFKPLSNPDMFTNSAYLVGKMATRNIQEHTILKKYMVK